MLLRAAGSANFVFDAEEELGRILDRLRAEQGLTWRDQPSGLWLAIDAFPHEEAQAMRAAQSDATMRRIEANVRCW